MNVGDKVWYVPSDRRWRKPFEATVTKVGRRWVETERGERFDRTTGVTDNRGVGAPDRVYASREAWEADVALQEAWRMLRLHIDREWGVPPGMTVEKIERIRELLAEETR